MCKCVCVCVCYAEYSVHSFDMSTLCVASKTLTYYTLRPWFIWFIFNTVDSFSSIAFCGYYYIFDWIIFNGYTKQMYLTLSHTTNSRLLCTHKWYILSHMNCERLVFYCSNSNIYIFQTRIAYIYYVCMYIFLGI